MRPPMPYAGGKQAVADRIAALLPPHVHYLEPFAGALSVLLAKPPSRMETVNDLNGDLVTFWRILRDRPDDLIRVCALTPHSRAELRQAQLRPADLDDLERARRVWVHATQGRSASLRTAPGWRFVAGSNRMSLPRYLDGYIARMEAAAVRLRAVSIEQGDAFDLIRTYDDPNVCIYADPPYLGATRNSMLYEHEMTSTDEHRRLLDALLATRASVVLSGYAHPLYDDALAGWDRREFAMVAQTAEARVDVLWINRPAQDHLFGVA